MNNKYIITCDIAFPRINNSKILKTVKSLGHWAIVGESAFIVVTSKSEVEVRNKIMTVLKRNDKVFVCRVGSQAAWYGLGDRLDEWLQNNLCKKIDS